MKLIKYCKLKNFWVLKIIIKLFMLKTLINSKTILIVEYFKFFMQVKNINLMNILPLIIINKDSM